MTRKLNRIFPLLAVVIIAGLSSCLQSGLEDFPEWNTNKIDNAYVEVRFNTDRERNGQPIVGYQKLTTVAQKIDTVNNTVHLTLGVPASSADFKSSIRQKVSLSEVYLYFDISTAASMKGIDGTPNPGYKTDATKPLTYEVTAANGDKRKWTVTIDPLPLINKFDGNYTMDGSMTDYSSATLTGDYPRNVALVTQSENSVALFDLELNDFYHVIKSGDTSSKYGSYCPVFTIDANNNVVSVVNKYGQPSPDSNARSAELDPSGINKWDPETKTLTVKYWMNQPSVITPHRVLFDETFKWKE